jgi:hypothetical protein
MIRKPALPLAISALLMMFFTHYTLAQKRNSTTNNDPSQRIRIAPESVFKNFRDAGMEPVNHNLNLAEKQKVARAFALLPPLHQRILKQHLHSISFMDNMPNTALTSPVDSGGVSRMFNITFRATLLNENISEWASWKENTCFRPADDADYKIRVEGGNMDAILYVLMHEATHIVDAVTEITPHPAETNAVVEPTPFTKISGV